MKFEDRKVFKLLRSLEKQELREFRVWLASIWCNPNRKLEQVFTLLRPFYPSFSSPRLTEQRLFTKLYPGRIYNDRMLRNILGDLSKSILDFWCAKRCKNDDLLKGQLLLSEYLDRNYVGWFVKEAEKNIEEIFTKKTLAWQDYLHGLLISEQLYYRAEVLFRQINEEGPLDLAFTNLDKFYLLGRLRFASEQKERARRLKQTYSPNIPIVLLGELVQQYPSPAVKLYWQHLNEVDESFEEFELRYQDYLNQREYLEEKDQRILLHYLINGVSRLFHKGNVQVLEIAFQLYELGVNTRLLLQNGQLTEHTYMNMVTVSNSLKYFEETERFIEGYTTFLPGHIKDDAYRFAIAHMCYHKGAFDQCGKALRNHRFASQSFVNRSKVLLLQTYYEYLLNDRGFFFTFWDKAISFEAFLRRDERLHEDRVKGYLNFSQYCRQLGKYFYDGAQLEEINQFVDQLTTNKNLQARPWLMDKAKQLKDKPH